jgi:hypothetical protein
MLAAAAMATPKEMPATETIAPELPLPAPEASLPEASLPEAFAPEASSPKTPPPAPGDEPAAPRPPDNAGHARDPLAPLKAMSEEERIALFS